MAAGATDVVIRFLSDVSDLKESVGKIQGTTDKFKSWAKGAGAALAGAFGVREIGDWISSAEEANAVSAGLAKTLANAGDATGEWAKHAENLADTLMKKTGIDDETIKGAQTILGTFHEVAGATGQASGAFDRATAAALDLSKAGFGDANSTATMLGKALEDPTQGLTALRRVGVNFTDDQEKLIKSLVDSGDKAGAMNVILGNVESQVGGVAEATATSGDKMKTAFGETQEALGQALLPAMQALAPILQTVAGFIQENAGWLVPLAAAVGAVTIAVWAFNAALAANPIVLITLALAALVGGLIYAYQNFEVFRNVVDAAISAVVAVFNVFWATVQAVFAWIAGNWPLLLAILTGPIGIAVYLIKNNLDAIVGFFGAVVGRIASALSTLGAIIVAPFQWAWDQIVRIKDQIMGVGTAIVDGFKGAWNAFARGFNNLAIPSFSIGGWSTPFGDLPSWDSPRVDFPDLPTLARGGLVTGAGLAMLHPAEVVTPLDRFGGGNITINITTTGLGADAPAIQRAVVGALRGYVGRNGPITGIAG